MRSKTRLGLRIGLLVVSASLLGVGSVGVWQLAQAQDPSNPTAQTSQTFVQLSGSPDIDVGLVRIGSALSGRSDREWRPPSWLWSFGRRSPALKP
ncbi:MAG: hypothetical protein ACREA0_25385, partial [bacterium]